MKINSRTLFNFLNKVTIRGNMTDGVLKFGPDGLSVSLKDVSNTGFSSGLLKTTAGFIDYKQMVAPVKSMATLLSFLKSISGTIELDIIDNNLVITSEDNNGRFKLAEEQYLECNLEKFPNFAEHDSGFEVDTKILTTAKNNATTLKFKFVYATVSNGEFYLISGEDEFDQLTAHARVDYKDVNRTMYASILLEFIDVIDGKAVITFNQDYPLLITVSTVDSILKWVVAPMTQPKENDE